MKIIQYLGGTAPWGDVVPETMRTKGLGGRETAMIQLAEAWAARGHEVINFVPTSAPTGEIGRCRYVPFDEVMKYVTNYGADVAVSWEEPRLFHKSLAANIGLRIIEMQVAHLDTDSDLDAGTDYYAVLSEWAGKFLTYQNDVIDEDKLVILPNGVDLTRYTDWEPAFPYDRARDESFKFYYSSSPDRGLNHLLNIWPKIRELYSNAELYVAYGIDKWVDATRWTHYLQSEAALDVADGIHQEGVKYLGKIGQDELARVQEGCDALLYPCDPMSPTETGCITVVEAGAAGCPAIITDADCLGTEFRKSAAISQLPFDAGDYCDTISSVMSDPDMYVSLQRRGRELARARDWNLLADRWLHFFEEEL